MTLRTTTTVLVLALTAGAAAAQKAVAQSASAPDAPALTSPKDKRSYAIGVDIGVTLMKQSLDVDAALLVRGLQDTLAGTKALLTTDEVRAEIAKLNNEMQQKRAAAMQQLAENNKKAGEAFLAENKAKEGVVALPSGLQYKILKAGDGQKPTAADTVSCHYRGTLVDGTEFDSSAKHNNQPLTIPVSGVIKGWTEALQLMPVGSEWQLVIPSDLAYGERGMGPIGPNSTLVFEIELLSIKDKPVPAASTPAPETTP
jgi:FKBP-type peptidyl-prolyl cis-trans isomerase FklB